VLAVRRDENIPAVHRRGFPVRIALLGSVSLLPMAAIFCAAHPAHAACPTVISSSVTGPVDTSTACDFSVTNTGIISGGAQGVHNNTAIGTLSNAGGIQASNTGADNSGGTIFVLNNAGTIQGGAYGIVNGPGAAMTSGANPAHPILNVTPSQVPAFIGTLANSGSITGGTYGVYNTSGIGTVTNSIGGYISFLDNAGSIGTGATAVINAGAIGTLANSGSITGSIGVANSAIDYNGNDLTTAYIGTLTNALPGTIFGTNTGIANSSTIASLSNNGTIAGGKFGITNVPAPVVSGPHYILNGPTAARLNQATIASLANTGSIIGGSTGIYNDAGDIGTLTNSGIIAGAAKSGVNNIGTIVILTNAAAGTITGKTSGVNNAGGLIGTLTNNGTISGFRGIYSGGTITTLTNNNLIAARSYGLENPGDIGQVTNNSIISGASGGIFNNGTIDGLTNIGTIFGDLVGINIGNGGIGTLTNAGVINGGDIGISNGDFTTIGLLTNAGYISGAHSGINSTGVIGMLDNTGTIEGATAAGLYLAAGKAINEAGGVIKGGAAGAVIGTPSQQTGSSSTGGISGANTTLVGNIGNIGQLTNTGVIAPHAIVNAITNDVVIPPTGTALVINQPGGLIKGAEGAVFEGTGSTLVNAGTIISTSGGNAIDFGPSGGNFLTLTTGSDILGTIFGGGTKNQIALNGVGTINNTITDFAPGSALNVAPGANWTAYGNWQIATVANDGIFQPGILGTPLNLTGNFVQNADGTLRVLVSPSDSPFVTTRFNITGTATLAGGLKYYFAPGTYSAGTISFLTAAGGITGGFSSVTTNDPPAALTDKTVITANNGDLRLSGIVGPLDDSIFSDEIQSSAAQAQSANTALLDKASQGEAAGAGAATCAAEAAVTPADVTPGQVSGVEKLTNAVASAICGAGGWIQATGTAMRAYGDANVPSYDAGTAGFLAGIDKPVNNDGLRLGLAVGYDETFLRNGAGSKGQVDTTRLGIFGSQPLGRFTLAGDFMAGFSNTTTNRVTGVGDANSTNAGDAFAGALQIETLEQINGLDLIPQAGIRIAAVNAGGFDETGNTIVEPFSLTGAHSSYDSVQPFVNLSLSHIFLTDNGITIVPETSLGYFYEAGARGRAVTLDARDGTVFTSHYIELAGSAGQGEFSLSASKGLLSLYASYSADLAGNWVSQTAEAGLRLRF